MNAALLDAALLVQRLVEGASLSDAPLAFEEGMFERIEEATRESADAAATFLSHDSLAETLAMYQGRLAHMLAPRDGSH